MFTAFEIKDKDIFRMERYPAVVSEVLAIGRYLSEIDSACKADIVISYLKHHSIRTDWMENNDDVVRVVTSGFLHTEHIKALFSNTKNNSAFIHDFEEWIKRAFAGVSQA